MRELPCAACKKAPCEELHHPRGLEFGTGMGLKASHMMVIPLCRACHDEFHRLGRDTWETKYGLQIDMSYRTKLAVLPHLYSDFP